MRLNIDYAVIKKFEERNTQELFLTFREIAKSLKLSPFANGYTGNYSYFNGCYIPNEYPIVIGFEVTLMTKNISSAINSSPSVNGYIVKIKFFPQYFNKISEILDTDGEVAEALEFEDAPVFEYIIDKPKVLKGELPNFSKWVKKSLEEILVINDELVGKQAARKYLETQNEYYEQFLPKSVSDVFLF